MNVHDELIRTAPERARLAIMMKAHPLSELVIRELGCRPYSNRFLEFAAAKNEINERGFQCAACSRNWHSYGKDAPYMTQPCSGCKGKKPLDPKDLP